MGLLGTIARHMDALVGYASMRAIESPSTVDDQQWLTYWILYSFLTLFELSCWKILAWLPFWPYMKLLFCLWLVLPIFNGAAYIYEKFVRKYINIRGQLSSNYPEGPKKALQMLSFDARKSVERYITKHGPDAFDKVVKVAEKEARKQRD
ncbi:HVA22-like protein f isoform X2 [Malania oleifera]|uniref:HVA22-like protein f isoform X2 n=1 Tax=Malania oleifera TaxID=397392 RepID=UPI0025AE7833|nr:HVA22-like protein f isoform X2 [Malania oleifera]